MTDCLSLWTLLAQDGKEPTGAPLQTLLFPVIVIGVLWYFLLVRPQSRERRRHEEMLKALKKNDRVVTIGGIVGTVANIGPEGKEVAIKVDDNTRIKFLRSSIQRVLKDEDENA